MSGRFCIVLVFTQYVMCSSGQGRTAVANCLEVTDVTDINQTKCKMMSWLRCRLGFSLLQSASGVVIPPPLIPLRVIFQPQLT